MTPPRKARTLPLLVLALALLLAACEGQPAPPPTSPDDGWPLGAPVDTVLAYLAETVPAEVLAGAFDGWVGWRPEGLDEGRPALLALLDASVLGGHAALLLPVRDPQALRRSLANCPNLSGLGGDRYQLRLPPDHELMRMVRLARGMVGARNVTDLLASLTEPSDTSLGWELHEAPGYALLVPSFEAAFVSRKLLQALPLERPEGLVISVDIERLRLAWWDELEDLETQVRGLLTGARSAGLAGLLGGALGSRRGGGGSGAERSSLPFARPWLWTLLTLFAPGDLAAVQLSGAVDGDGSQLFTAGASPELLRDARVQLAWNQDSALLDLLGTLRPAPVLDSDAPGLSLAADAAQFAPALARWLRPLVEEAFGVGAPSERALDELTALLDSWDGRLAAQLGDDGPVLLAGSRPGRRLEAAALSAWWQRLTSGLGAEQVLELPRHALADDVLVFFGDDVDPESIEDALAALDGAHEPLEAQAPVLSLRFGEQGSLGLTYGGRRLDLWIQLPGRD